MARDADLLEVGVYLFTYKTGFFSGTYHLGDAVDALKEHLRLDGVVTAAGVVFVCHSMGGIVVRKYLVSRTVDLIESDVPIALFLVASPSLGSDYARWLSPIARRLRHSQADALRFSQSNAWLNDLDRDFINLKEQRRLRLIGKELVEDRFVVLGWLWRKQIVEPFSGASYFGEPYKVPDSDHFSIAKIADASAVQHRLLRQFLIKWRVDVETRKDASGNGNSPSANPARIEVSFVLSLAVDVQPDNRVGLDRLQEAIRTIAGSPLITIVEARAGSLVLLLSDPEAALHRIDPARLREGLLELAGARLVGLAPIGEFDARSGRIRELTTASAELLAWPTALPDGEVLGRPELEQLRERVLGGISSTTALIGAAGSGKSALLANLARSFLDAGWPVLAIKADLLEPEIISEEMLQERLGLGMRPSEMLRELARSGPVLLVIDQLDALAGHLDIKTLRLSVLLNLVRAIGGADNVHVVLSSRPFEFQHDVRLRSAGAESMQLALPEWTEVLAVLESKGVAAAGWPADAQEVMRTPQALATYLKLGGHHEAQPFASYQLMLDRLWSERVLGSQRGGDLDRLASDIADAMADQESLWLATSRYADRSADLQALVAAGILTTVDTSVGFSHQTLFEFTLARSQARESGRLSRLARDRQSSLFLRPKLWASLTYLRGADRELYHGELEAVWHTDLRPHLRALLIDFLGSQTNPTDREAIPMDAALTEEATQLHAFRAVAGSAGWFRRIADSHVAAAMTGAEPLANVQIAVLTEALRTSPGKVVELIRDRWVPDKTNDLRAWAVIQWSSPWSEDALAVATTAITRTEMAVASIDYQAATAAVDQPAAALRLVRAKLDRDLDVAIENRRAAETAGAAEDDIDEEARASRRMLERVRDPLRNMVERGDEWDGLAGIAEAWPGDFLDALWPWLARILAELERTTGRDRFLGYTLAHEADFRFEAENNLGLPEGAILGALRVAVEGLADRDPERFRRWAADNDAVALTPVQRLIAHGIAHRPETFATEALTFVLGDERRYFLGSIHDMHGTIKRMVSAAGPFWSAEQVAAFEKRVREFAPSAPAEKVDPKERMSWRHMARHTQLELLRSLPKHQRSISAERQVMEDERRYGSEPRGTTFSGPLAVGSIIEADAMGMASDEDIVTAFVGLPDAVGWDNPRRRMAGGNVQLARAFAEFAKKEPHRAARILERLNNSNGVRAAAYAIEALADTGDSETALRMARDAIDRHFDGDEFRHSVARALDRLTRRKADVGADLLATMERWLDNPPADRVAADDDVDAGADADGEEIRQETATLPGGSDGGEAEPPTPGMELSLLWGHGGSGGYPGGDLPVVEALVSIRMHLDERGKAVETLSRFLLRERGIRHWEVLSRHFIRLGLAETSTGAAVLDEVLTTVTGVVGSKAFALLLADAQNVDHGLVDRHLDFWKDSDSTSAVQAYGEIVALDALLHPERDDTRRRLDGIVGDGGSHAARVGAALSAAHILAEEPHRRVEAANLLVRLVALPDPEIWPAAFEFFRLAGDLIPDKGTVTFLRAVADGISSAREIDPTFVVDRLATMLPHEADLVARIALALTAKWRSELADMRTATARATSPLVDLAVTLHRLGPDTRDIGLELFEQLIDIDAYDARQALDEIDGRFRGTAPRMRRPRLRRRSQGLPRRRHQQGFSE
ncbi:hypothetical protein ACH0BU_12760 [Sphingomonas olei]